MEVIAHIHTCFGSKFGVPRQSGIVDALQATITFTPPYRDPSALRGLEDFSHIWLLWDFSEAHMPEGKWSPTVRPPMLGGNQRMGVWATRSPFRPNHIGLSSVRLLDIEPNTPEGPVLHVAGADLMDGTPILDIKPYLPFTDAHPEAKGGFTEQVLREAKQLQVEIPQEFVSLLGPGQLQGLREILAHDPRPHYHNTPQRIYGMQYAGHEVKFQIHDGQCMVLSIEK